MNCSSHYESISYRILPNRQVRVFDDVDPYLHPPKPTTRSFIEKRVGLEALSDEPVEVMFQAEAGEIDIGLHDPLHYLIEPLHQVGGFPMIYNPIELVECRLCGTAIPFIATISDNATDNDPKSFPFPESFFRNAGVQAVFHYCQECCVVAAYQSND